jgi:hypothetical protein
MWRMRLIEASKRHDGKGAEMQDNPARRVTDRVRRRPVVEQAPDANITLAGPERRPGAGIDTDARRLQPRSRGTALAPRTRATHLKTIARAEGLHLERAGRGPLFDVPVLHRQRRLAWRIYPLDALHGIDLPERAARLKASWDRHGVFTRYYLADEIPAPTAVVADRLVTPRVMAHGAGAFGAALATLRVAGARTMAAASRTVAAGMRATLRGPARATARALPVPPDPCLIGVVSIDEEIGEWFVLDRWRH